MGIDKWKLPLGAQTLLDRTVGTLRTCTKRIVMVASQTSTPLPVLPGTEIAWDENRNCGPIEGIRVGLRRLESDCEVAFVTACDAPLLQPAIVRFLTSQLADHQAAIPAVDGRVHPLTAVYRTDIHPRLLQIVRDGDRRAAMLSERLDTHLVSAEAMQEVDPLMASLTNINRPDEYLCLLNRLGLICDPEIRDALGGNRPATP